MLFQPSNIAPSTLSGIGIGTVDVTKGIDVSWQVNGDSPMTAYQITIYQNDTASTEMYTTGQISLSTPFQTHDVSGNPMFFSTSISAATLASAGIVNGYANGYKIIIKQWWGPSDFVEQTSASVFITRTTPTLSIDAIPNPVTTNSATITATYAQAEGDPISTVEWTFALAGLEDTPIKQTGAIGTQILSFVADGLISGNTYSIMCNVVSASGMEVSTGFVQFPVSYPSSSIDVEYQVAQLKNSSATYLSWTGFGKNVLAYPYADSTKTTNGITFTVNGEGDISVSGTATADAHFTIASGTLSQLGFTVGQKFVVSIGSQIPSAFIEITETNSSNVVVSTITGSTPLQYVVPQTSNTISFDVVIPSGSSPSSEIQPMLFEESRIVAVNDLSVSMQPIQSLNGYSHPWPAGGGKNLVDFQEQTLPYSQASFVAVDFGEDKTFSSIVLTFFMVGAEYGSNSGAICNFQKNDGTNQYRVSSSFGLNVNGVNTGSFSRVESNITFRKLVLYLGPGYGNYSAGICSVQLEEGSAATAYTPYSNICPISGLTGLSVYRTGKNLVGITLSQHNANNLKTNVFSLPKGTFAISVGSSVTMGGIYLRSGSTISAPTIAQIYNSNTLTVTLTEAYSELILQLYNGNGVLVSDIEYVQIEAGSATAYEPYQGQTISVDWTSEAGTVYGGTLNLVTGLLTVDRAKLIFDGSSDELWVNWAGWYAVVGVVTGENYRVDEPLQSNSFRYVGVHNSAPNQDIGSFLINSNDVPNKIWNRNISFKFDNAANVANWKTYLASNPIEVTYPLATPLTYQLTPQEVTLLTQSIIWSDGGDVTVSYEKNDGTQPIKSGEIVSIDDSMAQNIPDPTFVPAISGVSIYRYSQGDPILQKVYDITDGTTTLLDYYVPSQSTVSYLIVAHTASNDLFALTNQFTPTFWAYSILLCSTDSNGNYHVRQEYAFRYGVETGAVSNNNNPAIQQNFTRYPTRQPTNSQYKTGTLKGYIGTVSDQKLYTDSVSLQNAIYDISTSQLTKFLKTRKGETIMIDCAAQIQMQTGDNMREQPLVATIEWVEVGSSAESSIVSVPSDSFWPLS